MSRKRIDLGKVRAARRALQQSAKEHPRLLGERGPENVKEWESILAENEMGKTTLVAFRLENELLKRIDAYAKRLEDQTPGLKLARADAVRILLVRGLSEVKGGRKARASSAPRTRFAPRRGCDLSLVAHIGFTPSFRSRFESRRVAYWLKYRAVTATHVEESSLVVKPATTIFPSG